MASKHSIRTLRGILESEKGAASKLDLDRELLVQVLDDFEKQQETIQELKDKEVIYNKYIRDKINQLLHIMGTKSLKPEELDDSTLISIDPIGIVGESFVQVLNHLRETNIDLKQARDEISAIFDSVGVGILVVDVEMNILEYNAVMEKLFDTDDISFKGKSCRNIFCRNSYNPINCTIGQILERKQPVHISNWFCNDRHFDVVGTPIHDSNGAIVRVVNVYMDITDRLKAEERLRMALDRAETIFQVVPSAIFTVDTQKRITSCNKKAEELTGYGADELIGNQCTIFAKEPCLAMCNLFNDANEKPLENRVCQIKRKDGAIRTISKNSDLLRDNKGEVVGGIESFEDITKVKAMEENITRVTKLESLGILAGGLAHDFNNLLTSVLANVSLAKLRVSPENILYEQLHSMEKASIQAKNLTNQLLTFSKGGAPVKSTASIAELIKDSAEFSSRGSTVRCDISIPDDLPILEVDPGQISQVFQNLVLNARQAMPKGGVIRITARNRQLVAGSVAPLPPGDYVEIIVADEGSGIPKDYIQKIFDPYFSTKDTGSDKGAGLGLAICHSIIEKHEGLITVQSEDGIGATFTILLPVGNGPQQPLIASKKIQPEVSQPQSSAKKILLMDDEQLILNITSDVLSHFGYQVDCAKDGEEALSLYKQSLTNDTSYDAVVLDLTIPGGMGGRETMEKMLQLDPQVKAIVSSGYANDPIMANFREYGFAGVIVKPYQVDEIMHVLTSVTS